MDTLAFPSATVGLPGRTPLRAPRSPRELFALLSHYTPVTGLAGLTERIDWDWVGKHQLYAAILQRRPETALMARLPADRSPADEFVTCITSREFQSRFAALFLAAFPEKQRLLFVHIPKCAGLHLTSQLSARIPSLMLQLADPVWGDPAQILVALHDLVGELPGDDRIFVHGHQRLGAFLESARFGDHLFTVVRDPVDLMISYANYILTTLLEDPGADRADSRLWLAALGMEALPADPSEAMLQALAGEILANPAMVPTHSLTHHLGDDTAESAIETCAVANIEITDLAHYPDWLRSRFGLAPGLARNVSRKILTRQTLTVGQRDALHDATEQDRALYAKIAAALASAGTEAISGLALV